MSIPVMKPFLRRKDMDAVLTCLVEDHLGPGQETDALVDEVRALLSCASGFALRDSLTAWRTLFRGLKAKGISSMAVCALAGQEIALAAQEAGMELLVLDALPDMPLADLSALEGREGLGGLILNYTCGFVPDLEKVSETCSRLGLLLVEDLSHAFCQDLLVQGLEQKSAPEADDLDLVQGSPEEEAPASEPGLVPGRLGRYVLLQTEFDSLLTTGGGCVVLARTSQDAQALQGVREDLPPAVFMSDMNAALGRTQIKALPEMLKRRTDLYISFRTAVLRGRQQCFRAPFGHFPHSLPVMIQSSVAEVQAFARKKGIETAFAFQGSLLGKLTGEEGEAARLYPKAYGMMLRTLLFPLHCGLHQKDVELLQKVLPSLP